ncbi:MAG: hypothetical protein AAFY06_00200 [Pseudomonadota bacterium]
MADLPKAYRNVKKLRAAGAPDEEIDRFLAEEKIPYEKFTAFAKRISRPFMGTERSSTRRNASMLFGWDDELAAAGLVPLQGVSSAVTGDEFNPVDAYWENLEVNRQRKKEAFEGSEDGDLLADAAGIAGSLAAGVPRAAATGTAAAANALTSREVAAQSMKVGAGYGALYGTGEAEGSLPEQAETVLKHTAGGAILGRAAPNVINAVGNRVVRPVMETVRSARERLARATDDAAQDFERAGIEPFAPAMTPEGSAIDRTAGHLMDSVAGQPVRQGAQRAVQQTEDAIRAELTRAGANRTVNEAGEETQELLRRQLAERSLGADDVRRMTPEELQDVSGIGPAPTYNPPPPRVEPVRPAPVRPVTPDEVLDEVGRGVPPVQPQFHQPVQPRNFPEPQPNYPKPTTEGFRQSAAVKAAQTEAEAALNTARVRAEKAAAELSTIQQPLNQSLDAIGVRGISPARGDPTKILVQDAKTLRTQTVDAAEFAAQSPAHKAAVDRSLQTGAAVARLSREARRAQDELGAATSQQRALQQAKERETQDWLASEAKRMRSAEDARVASLRQWRATQQTAEAERVAAINAARQQAAKDQAEAATARARQAAIEKARPNAETIAASRTEAARRQAAEAAEQETARVQSQATAAFERDQAARQARADVPFQMGRSRETYPSEFDVAYEAAGRNAPKVQSNVLGRKASRTQAAEKSPVTGLIDSIAVEARRVGGLPGYKAGQPFDESGALLPAVEAVLRQKLGNEVTQLLSEAGRKRAGNLFSPGIQGRMDLRTAIGEQLGRLRRGGPSEKVTMEGQEATLSRLYDALTDDTQRLMRANGGERAARQFREIQDSYREFVRDLRAPLRSVFSDKTSPAQAIKKLKAAAGPGGDINVLRAFFRVADDKASTSVATNAIMTEMLDDGLVGFLRQYRTLSPDARRLMFSGPNADLGRNLDRLARVGGRLERYARHGRMSRAPMDLAMRPSNATLALLGYFNVPTAIGAVVGSAGLSRLMTSPRFLQWMRQYPQAALSRKGPSEHATRLRAIAMSQLGYNEATAQALVDAVMGDSDAI